MAGFIDVLANLNSQNFGAGLAIYGKAMHDIAVNKKISKLVDKYKEEKAQINQSADLDTTESQIQELEKSVAQGDTKDTIDTLITQATANMLEAYGKTVQYNELLNKYIIPLSTLGDEGKKIANMLSDEIERELKITQAKTKIPVDQLRLMQMKQEWEVKDFNLTKSQLDYNKKMKIDEISAYIMGLDSFRKLPGGNVTTYNPDRWKEWQKIRTEVINEARQRFGADTDLVNMAFYQAQKYAGNEFRFVDKPKEPEENIRLKYYQEYAVTQLPTDLTYLQQMSSWWNTLDLYTRDQIKNIIKNPAKITEMDLDKLSSDQVKKLVEAFGADGQYYKTVSRVRDYFKNVRGIDIGREGIYQRVSEKLPNGMTVEWTEAPGMTGLDFIIPASPVSFLEDTFLYNPYDKIRSQKLKEEAKAEIENQNVFNPVEYYNDIDLMGLYMNQPGALGGAKLMFDYLNLTNKEASDGEDKSK